MVSLKNFWVRCTKLRGKRQGSGQHESINIFFGSPFLEQLLECRGLNTSTCRTHCPTAPPYPYNERFSFSRKELHTSMKFDRLGEPAVLLRTPFTPTIKLRRSIYLSCRWGSGKQKFGIKRDDIAKFPLQKDCEADVSSNSTRHWRLFGTHFVCR